MAMSVVNRVRLTAWAWLASAFLIGSATGVVAAGVPLWNQLQAARDDAVRLERVEQLTRHGAPGGDVETLASLEEPPHPSVSPVTPLPQEKTDHPVPAPAPILARQVAPSRVAKVDAPAGADAAVAAPPAPAPAIQPPARLAPQGPSEAERPAVEARRAAQAAEEAERRAKAERQAKLEREQKLAKVAQEAQQRKEREERDTAEARAAAARPKPQVESPEPREPAVQVAAPVPVAGTNAPTERVTKEEAGLTEVQAGGVAFKSGRRVAVGDTFPSGEKLISVDPRIGEIITNKRRIVLKQ